MNIIPFLLASSLLTGQAFASETKIQALAVPFKSTTALLSSEHLQDVNATIVNEEKLISSYPGPGLLSAKHVFDSSEAGALGSLHDPGLAHTLLLTFSDGKSFENFRSWAARSAPDFKIEKDPIARVTSEDPLRSLQWGLSNSGGTYSVPVDDFTTKNIPAVAGEDIDLGNVPTATKPVIVAVLDSGVDITHPDLKDAIVKHDAECAALAQYKDCALKRGDSKCTQYQVDHDGNGYPLDCNGWNLAPMDDGHGAQSSAPLPSVNGILGNTDVTDYVGHGTHVAGIIAAQLNGIGIEGVAPQAKILPVRVISGEPNENIRAQELAQEPQESALGNPGYGMGDIVARGVLYAIRSGANIINMSLGWPDPLDSELLRRMLALAQQQGILVVAAAGNDSTDSVIFPCRYDGVVCVGANTPDGALAFFSNYGYGVDVLAPGWNILSTIPTGLLPLNFTDQQGYDSKVGTSMAAPFVSGMLARMLGAGMNPDEAYSRLILGARPTRPSQIENPALFANSSLSGNADLARSFSASPEPLVLPVHKDPIRVEWNRSTRNLPVTFTLENHWIDGSNARISIKPKSSDVRLAKNAWSVSTWKAGAQKSFSTQLELVTPELSSVQDFEVSVQLSRSAARSFEMRVQIVSPISARTADSGVNVLPLVDSQGESASRNYSEIHTVVMEFDSGQEYLGVTSNSSGRMIELLAAEARAGASTGSRSEKLVIRGSLSLPANGNQITSLRKIKDLATGRPIYVLIESLPATQGGMATPSQFTWLDDQLQPLAGQSPFTIDNKITYLAEDFQWQSRSGELVATWYGMGQLPPSEAKPFDPWNPSGDPAAFRMYLLAKDGLHTVDLPKDYSLMVSLLPQSAAQKQSGTVSVMLAQGNDYALQYATAELNEGQWKNITPITLPNYHNLRGIEPSLTLSLEGASVPGTGAGAAYSGYVGVDVGPGGARRTTLISSSGAGSAPSVSDITAQPQRNFDAVGDVTATFAGAHHQMAFSLTKYEIQLDMIASNRASQRAMIDQNRFSFMPVILAVKSLFPTLVQSQEFERATGEKYTAALFTPPDFIFSKASQVILPRFDRAGNLVKLDRPAKFHLEAQEGCSALPTARPASTQQSSAFLFFCGDRMIAVPLIF